MTNHFEVLSQAIAALGAAYRDAEQAFRSLPSERANLLCRRLALAVRSEMADAAPAFCRAAELRRPWRATRMTLADVAQMAAPAHEPEINQ
jgi:hypothetical protein